MGMADLGQTGVPQVSKPAVSLIAKSAGHLAGGQFAG